jgi:hypothetical protein
MEGSGWVPHDPRVWLKRALAVALLVVSFGLIAAGPTWAAGTPYVGGTGPAAGNAGGPTTPSGFTTVVTTETVQPSGGTVTGTSGTTTVTVSIPAGAVASPIQVVIRVAVISDLTGLPAGSHATIGVGVTFEQNGQKYTGTFSVPVAVTVSDPGITAADEVVVYDSATGNYVPVSQASNVSDVSVSNGKITFDVLSDPYIVISAAITVGGTTTVAGATSSSTGVPVVTEAVVGAALIVLGLVLARRLRRSPLDTLAQGSASVTA